MPTLTLTDIITNLVEIATLAPNTSLHTRLGRGLHLWLKFNGTGTYRFTLGRQLTQPSFQEWNTCCTNWPYKLTEIPTPKRTQDEHAVNFYLTGYIPAPALDHSNSESSTLH
jgi:hypothetical protein